MVRKSKISGLMIEKREIFVYGTNEFVKSSTISQDSLIETIKFFKSKSHEVKMKMNKTTGLNLEKNMGFRRNVNFKVDKSLETEIVTRTDYEGTKNFLVKSENPFEQNLNYIADDKDFFTEQTEDEDEFRESSGYDNTKRDRITGKSSEMEINTIEQSNNQKEFVTQFKEKVKLKKTSEKLSEKQTRTKETEKTSKRKRMDSDIGYFKRNIFANFKPKGVVFREYEFNEPYIHYAVGKMPCKTIRKTSHSNIYLDITGQRKNRSRICINIPIKSSSSSYDYEVVPRPSRPQNHHEALKPAQEQPEVIKPIQNHHEALKTTHKQPEVIKPIQNHHEALKTTHKQPEVIKPIQNHHGILKTTHKQPEVIKPIQNHHEALKTTQEQPEVIKPIQNHHGVLKTTHKQPEVIKPIQNHHEALKTTHKQPEVIKPIQNHHEALKTTHKQPEVIKPIQNHHEALKTTQEQPEVIKNPSGQQYLEEESTEPVYSYYEDEIQDMRNVPVTHNESKFSHMAGDTTDLSSYFVKAESSSETNSQLF